MNTIPDLQRDSLSSCFWRAQAETLPAGTGTQKKRTSDWKFPLLTSKNIELALGTSSHENAKVTRTKQRCLHINSRNLLYPIPFTKCVTEN